MTQEGKSAKPNWLALQAAANKAVAEEVFDEKAVVLIAELRKLAKLIDVGAQGVGIAIAKSEEAAKASSELLRMELEDAKKEEAEKLMEKPKERKIVHYSPEGKAVAVSCGGKMVKIEWAGEKAVAIS